VVDRQLFELYVTHIETADQARVGLEELIGRARLHTENFQTRIDEWNKSGPHDPVETLGFREHARSIRELSGEMTRWRLDFVSSTLAFEEEFIALANSMLTSENYELEDLLTRRLEETRKRIRERLPTLKGYLVKLDDANARFDAFIDECNAKGR
jgi:hypothetical protein